MTFLGILAIIIAVFLIVAKIFAPKNQEGKSILSKWKASYSVLLLVGGLFLSMLSGALFYAEAGTAYAVQYLWGGAKVVNTNGYALKWWGKVIPINFELVVKDLTPTDYKKYVDSGEDESDYAYVRQASPQEFNDAVNGLVASSVIINIDPSNEDKFLKIAFNNKSEKNLVHSRIMTLIDAAKKNTAKLMSAQEYIAGKSAYFDEAFRDQLENGTYQLIEVENTTNDVDTIGSKTTKRTVNKKGQTKTKSYKPKKVKGEILREGEGLREYGLIVRQANAPRIDWEAEFDKRLTDQKAQVAETQLEKQKAEKAVYKTKRLYQEGEAAKVEEKAKLEKEQLTRTISAETRAKEEEFNLEAAKKKYETAQYEAKTKKTEADAKYYENKKLVAAGLTPQEREKFRNEREIGIAAEIAKTNWPDNYFSGSGNSNGGGMLYDLIGADYANKMLKPNTSKK
jgi:hypothetical protein